MLDPIVNADPGDETSWLDDLDTLTQDEIDELLDLTGVEI